MATGDPTGGDLASVTVNASTIPQAAQWVDFTFDTPYALQAGYTYCIIMSSSSVDLANKIEWGQDTNAGYSFGLKILSTDSGSSWAQISSRDLTFRTFNASGQVSSFETQNAWQAIYGDTNILAQSWATISQAYTITKVQLYCRRTTASPPGTITVSIRQVDEPIVTKATTPSPTDAATGQSISLSQLTWVSGDNGIYDNVYFGEEGNMQQVDIVNIDQSFDLSDYLPLSENTTYQWRIDTVGSVTITGDTWSFTTLTFAPPDPATVGEFKMIKRLVACAENRFWYEAI